MVENRRCFDGRTAQLYVLYLGELYGRKESSWRRTVELFGQDGGASKKVMLFPEDHTQVQSGDDGLPVVRIRLSEISLYRPRRWGASWFGCELWRQLRLDAFWREHLPSSREGTPWDLLLQRWHSTS